MLKECKKITSFEIALIISLVIVNTAFIRLVDSQTTNPPTLILNTPEIELRTITINGITLPGTPNTTIIRIHWDWGDGSSEDAWFPASHTYDKFGAYVIIVTSYQSDGLLITESVNVAIGHAVILVISIGAGDGSVLVEDTSGADIATVSGAGTIQDIDVGTCEKYVGNTIYVNLIAYPAQGYVFSRWYYSASGEPTLSTESPHILGITFDNPYLQPDINGRYRLVIVVEFTRDHRPYIVAIIAGIVIIALALYIRHRKHSKVHIRP